MFIVFVRSVFKPFSKSWVVFSRYKAKRFLLFAFFTNFNLKKPILAVFSSLYAMSISVFVLGGEGFNFWSFFSILETCKLYYTLFLFFVCFVTKSICSWVNFVIYDQSSLIKLILIVRINWTKLPLYIWAKETSHMQSTNDELNISKWPLKCTILGELKNCIHCLKTHTAKTVVKLIRKT